MSLILASLTVNTVIQDPTVVEADQGAKAVEAEAEVAGETTGRGADLDEEARTEEDARRGVRVTREEETKEGETREEMNQEETNQEEMTREETSREETRDGTLREGTLREAVMKEGTMSTETHSPMIKARDRADGDARRRKGSPMHSR